MKQKYLPGCHNLQTLNHKHLKHWAWHVKLLQLINIRMSMYIFLPWISCFSRLQPWRTSYSAFGSLSSSLIIKDKCTRKR
jgi:hypothetical protein